MKCLNERYIIDMLRKSIDEDSQANEFFLNHLDNELVFNILLTRAVETFDNLGDKSVFWIKKFNEVFLNEVQYELSVIDNKEKKRLRELLIKSLHSDNSANEILENNLNNNQWFDYLTNFIFYDYSNDVKMQAAYWLSKYDISILLKEENTLLSLMKFSNNNISSHIMIALGRIKSKKGFSLILERIKPKLYWEATALKLYFEE